MSGLDKPNFNERVAEYSNRFETPVATLSTDPDVAGEQQELFPLADIVIRSELNISKFADFIFESPRSKKLNQIRTYKFGAGETTGSISVQPGTFQLYNSDETLTRTPTVITEEYFCTFIQLWEQRGCPEDGVIVVSGREIFRILGKKAGKAQYRILERELHTLQSTSLTFIQSFVDTKEGTLKKKKEVLSLLSSFSYYTRSEIETNNIFAANIIVRFDSIVLNNLLNHITKPIAFREKLTIDSYDARRLYSKFDVILSPHQRTRKRTATKLLFEDLGITSKRYESRRIRKAKLLDFKAQLHGKRVSRGVLSISVQEGKEDWLLVATLLPSKAPRRAKRESPANPESVAKILFEDMQRIVGISAKPTDGFRDPIGMVYATTYPARVIEKALSVFKADALHDKNVKNKIKVFTTILHREVHKASLSWIGKCEGKNCRFHPENDLFGDKF